MTVDAMQTTQAASSTAMTTWKKHRSQGWTRSMAPIAPTRMFAIFWPGTPDTVVAAVKLDHVSVSGNLRACRKGEGHSGREARSASEEEEQAQAPVPGHWACDEAFCQASTPGLDATRSGDEDGCA